MVHQVDMATAGNNEDIGVMSNSSDMLVTEMKLDTLTEDHFDCPLCQSLLYDPITTSCGHSFCKDCILRAMDHDNKCPMCRTVIHVTPEYGVSVILSQIIKQTFPQQYISRREEKNKELTEQHFNMPLFLLGQLVLFPNTALPLHVFEPRYRLMVRRCIEGSHRFGVVPCIGNSLAQVGCTATIENHYIFPDGRSLIATAGEKRFKLLSCWDQDGYKIAKVEYFDDDPISEESTRKLNEKFMATKELVTTKLQSVLPQVEEKIGKMPQTNAVQFSWWLASVVPISVEEKVTILESRSAEARLDILLKHINSLVTSSDSGCVIS